MENNNNIEKKEIIENIYKDKITERIENKEISLIEENKKENENDKSQSSIVSPGEQKKRRQGLWFGNLFPKDKEENNSNKNDNEERNTNNNAESEKSQIKQNYFFNVRNKIKEYETSKTGCIIMLIIVFITLIYYDFKIIFIPNKYRFFYRIFYGLIIFYSSMDFIFRNILIHNLINTFYFWIDLISSMMMIFDIDSISYSIFKKIMYPNSKNKYMSYEEQSNIEIIINVFQVIKLIRVIKFYKLFADLIKENEKKRNIKKLLEKMNEKKNIKSNKRLTKNIKITLSVKDNNNNNNNNNNTTSIPINQTPVQGIFEGVNKSPKIRKIIPKCSILTSGNSLLDNKKWEEDMIKYIKEHIYKKNKISEKVTEGISRLMIIIVLLVFIVSIFTDEDNYNSSSFSYKLMCRFINKFTIRDNITNPYLIEKFIENYLFTNVLNQYPIIQIEWNNLTVYQNTSMKVKYAKRDICYIFEPKNPLTVIIISRRDMSKNFSIIYLIRLFYIVICISILCYLINSNIYELIFHPLEKIGKVIDIVSKDPVGSKTVTELKNNVENNQKSNKEDKGSIGYEIKIIQNAIIRISALMAIGFGEAGGEILKENISSSEGLNPMLPGKKIQAIFGFCFIHNFSEINEAFQEKTMIFVNQISDIVHSCVDKFNGITNKNLGDCYLLAWKFKDKKTNTNNNYNNININNNNNNNLLTTNNNNINNNLLINNIENFDYKESSQSKNSELGDCALLSFLNIIKKINKSQNILSYRKDPDLLKKFGPKYTVQMGFGLHTGWGIEGAIGSYYKIDCSYLSPNVNIAARLETATNIYGVDILFSGEFYELLSDFMKTQCRKIDVVTLKGSEKPVSLYTVDVNRNIHPGKSVSKKDRMTLRERRSYYNTKKKKLWHRYYNNVKKDVITIGESYYKQSKGLRQLLKKSKSKMFYQYFEDGFNDYIDGEWKEAAINLEKARYLDKSDGPTKTILEYIKSLDFKAPINWDGYRVLTSKT